MTTSSNGKRIASLRINGREIAIEPKETILQAALRNGIDFPFNCRVGGCGTCKCRVAEGRVRELTESGYLLTADEIDSGFVLACQSVPEEDVSVEVELEARTARRAVRGRVVAQTRLTRDVTRLDVELDESMPYAPGQYASVSIEGLDGVARNYSFASPPRDDRRVTFMVRKVSGGLFSSLVSDEDVTGRAVRIEGPFGEFRLRKGTAPLLFAAGSTGIAPVLAILAAAATAGVERSVTLLFGVREERDLFALDEIEAIARSWRGSFRFVPVLTGEPPAAGGTSAGGDLASEVVRHVEPDSHVYLCGSPAMIDGALGELARKGVRREHVHFDRFTTRADEATVASAPSTQKGGGRDAGALSYLKYFLFHAVGIYSAATILAGGHRVTAGLLAVLAFYVLGDALLGDDTSAPSFKRPGILTLQLWLALPLLAIIVFSSLWSVSAGDPLGFGSMITSLTGYDVIAARDATTAGHHVSAWILTGLMIGLVGTIPAHELTHRTWDRASMLVGRWLLAFSFDTIFAIEHVHGHHRYVSTTEDPATAPRGRNVYAHIVASTVKGNISAWRIEAARLAKKRLPLVSRHNAVIRGHLMSMLLVAGAFAMGGWTTALWFVACALWGKALLEIVNYMEHYGIVRNPASPVHPRHSWNTNRRISSWTMFNLTRHSHHHAQGEVPFQDLEPYPNSPMMINGYLTTIVVALVPPLWHALMTPRLLAWDADYASAEERGLATLANARSGIAALAKEARSDR